VKNKTGHLYSIIPKPSSILPQEGHFQLNERTKIFATENNVNTAKYLRELFCIPTGYPLDITDSPTAKNAIQLICDTSAEISKDEGYDLQVYGDSISIISKSKEGLFYGIQTIRHLLPPEIEHKFSLPHKSWTIPCCKITDFPRFSWRGFMLDEGRHFQGKENILRTIDLMALQKLNVLHWHLTEDQGWRIEIKAYPRLTEIGSHRSGSAVSMVQILLGRHNRIPHNGFYSQDEVREIVSYAAERYITIVPEIELPGHCTAALSAYPDLSCTGGPFEIPTRFGIFKDIFCAGKAATFEFIKAVMDEVVMLFASPIIHIGGDESPVSRWKKCKDCQTRIRNLDLDDEKALRNIFLDQVIDYLHRNNRQVMGWNEIIHKTLTTDAVIQYWMGPKKPLLSAMENGNPMVASPFLELYLDHSYNLTSLERVYRYEPYNSFLGDYSENILGVEAPLWTEWVPNQDRMDYQTFPRLIAVAETGWTPQGAKNYTQFLERLHKFNHRLDIIGVKYAKPEEWDPPFYKQLFGLFSIAKAQAKTSQ
jgi:hexosaminidase